MEIKASIMEIKVRIVSQYGTTRVFPACHKSDAFCSIAGTVTLTDSAIKAIKYLGYTVTVMQDVTSL